MLSNVRQLVNENWEKPVGLWLLTVSGAIFFMILLGGYTRLSKSGLSMVKWKPLGEQLPASEEQWQEEFEHYKKYPEYSVSNPDMDLEGFKRIFFVEWFHRQVGRSLGVLFAVPFASFLAAGALKKKMIQRLTLMLAFGGL